MKTVIFGDVHGNHYALKALIEREQDADFFICLGDLVGYGPYNDECIELLQELNHVYIKGNHEEMFIDGMYHQNCSDLAKKFFSYSYSRFTKDKYLDVLKSLPDSYDFNGFKCVHTLNQKHIYPNTDLSEFNMEGSYLIGHSHIQFDIKNALLNVINVGSLGQNRKSIGVGEYAVYQDDIKAIEFQSISDIAIEKFIDDLCAIDYDPELVKYYTDKL